MANDVSEAEFQSEVIDSPVPVLVDFWGEHCGFCKQIAPLLDQLADEFGKRAKVVKIDVGPNLPLAAKFGVRSLPTFLFFENGEVKDQHVGAGISKEQLKAKLEALCF